MLKRKHFWLIILISIVVLFIIVRSWNRIAEFNHSYKDEILSLATLVIAFFTATLWYATTGLYKMALKQSKDMEASLKISHDAVAAAIQANNLNREIFLASERPWIPARVGIAGPLEYSVNGLTIHLAFHLKNIGKSPAKNVWVDFRFIAPVIGLNYDPVSIQKEMSEEFRQRPAMLGHTVFPDEEIILHISTSVSQEDLKKCTEKFEAIFPFIVGIIGYNFVFEEGHHQTGFIYDVRRIGLYAERSKQKNRSPQAIFPDEGDIPKEDIGLVHYPLGGFLAD